MYDDELAHFVLVFLLAPTSRLDRLTDRRLSSLARSISIDVYTEMAIIVFRRPKPVYADIGKHLFPPRSVIDNFPPELKDYYLKVLNHLETRCDLEPASKTVI